MNNLKDFLDNLDKETNRPDYSEVANYWIACNRVSLSDSATEDLEDTIKETANELLEEYKENLAFDAEEIKRITSNIKPTFELPDSKENYILEKVEELCDLLRDHSGPELFWQVKNMLSEVIK